MKKLNIEATVTHCDESAIDEILREFEMGCDEAIIRREGKRMILEPKKRTSPSPKSLGSLHSNYSDNGKALFPFDIRF